MSSIKKISSFLKDYFTPIPKFEGENAPFQEAIYRYSRNRSEKNLDTLSTELTKAYFLIPYTDQKAMAKKKAKPKKKVAAKKKKKKTVKNEPEPIVLLYISDEKGRVYLPAFSHPSESMLYFGKETQLAPITAKELWSVGLQNEGVSGVVIDPGSTLWILSRDHLEVLRKEK
ncbi:SseB family protein [Leptospira langatensis]|uniref:SseB family protein n=1 Tax=Leptospira langatensis TaxID=2484983 RepID=A0A5F1ZU92_9LEPT|nr:SseB family protein [Leptospira langatensis]TGJ98918.1 SseB family protein [Leptospira langatensis]TGL40515.1 SseB family protein [Leptospira langatensis]